VIAEDDDVMGHSLECQPRAPARVGASTGLPTSTHRNEIQRTEITVGTNRYMVTSVEPKSERFHQEALTMAKR